MDHFRYRGMVKAISYIDMTFSLLSIALTITAASGVVFATVSPEYPELRLFYLQGNTRRLQDDKKLIVDLSRTFVIIWILCFTFNILQFFSGCALLSSTDLVDPDDLDEEDSKAVQKCRFWQCTSVFLFLVIVFLVYLNNLSPIFLAFGALQFVFRAVGILLVDKYVGELNEENNPNSSSARLDFFE